VRSLLAGRDGAAQQRMLQDVRVRAPLSVLGDASASVRREEQELAAALAAREARAAECAQLREQLRRLEEELAVCTAAVSVHEERVAAAQGQEQEATDALEEAVAAALGALALEERAERAAEAARLREAALAIERDLGLPAAASAAARIPWVPWEHLTLGRQIGRGSFKTVHAGDLRGTPVAALLVPGGTGLEAEVALMARLGNAPNVAVCYGLAREPPAAAGTLGRDCLVMEHAPHGALSDCLEGLDEAALPPAALLAIAVQVAQGMSAVAAAGIIHCDLAARNVLVFATSPPHVKVTDFGLSRLSAGVHSVPGTHGGVLAVRWAPPEAISGRRRWVPELSDMWSFGVLLWEVYTRGFVPYDLLQSDEAVATHVCGGGRLDQPAGCPDAVYGVMRACWAQRPQERPSFATIAAWLQGIARGEDARPALPPPEERAARECVICMSEPRVVVALPCRHCTMCEPCSQLVRDCPIDRQPIERTVVLTAPPDRTFVVED
jgi:hypothetical protein